jgi:hypothetical protein
LIEGSLTLSVSRNAIKGGLPSNDPDYNRIYHLSLLGMYDPDKTVANLPLIGQGMVEAEGGVLAIAGGVQSGEYKAAAVGVHFTLMLEEVHVRCDKYPYWFVGMRNRVFTCT